jgi:hypothetical protein
MIAVIRQSISYATANASMKFSPLAEACSAAVKIEPKFSLGWQRPPGAANVPS